MLCIEEINEFSHLFSLPLSRYDVVVVGVVLSRFFFFFYLFSLQSSVYKRKRNVNCFDGSISTAIDAVDYTFIECKSLSLSMRMCAGAQSVDDVDANDDPEIVCFIPL